MTMRLSLSLLSLMLLAACAYGYDRLSTGDKMYYGTLIYIPEIKGGKFDGTVTDPSTISGLDVNDYVDGVVSVCVTSSLRENLNCYPLIKNNGWLLGDRKDITTPGVVNLDSHDVFVFRAKPDEALNLVAFKVGSKSMVYGFWLKRPIALQSSGQINYLGNLTLQLGKSGVFRMYHLAASVTDRFSDSAAMMYEQLNIPLTIASSRYLLNLDGAEYHETTEQLIQQPTAVPVFIPKVK